MMTQRVTFFDLVFNYKVIINADDYVYEVNDPFFILFLTSNEEFKNVYFGLNNIFPRYFLFPTFLNIKTFPNTPIRSYHMS